ncbi:hypothetical protein L9F63_021333, partial [Diploptera punctata]
FLHRFIQDESCQSSNTTILNPTVLPVTNQFRKNIEYSQFRKNIANSGRIKPIPEEYSYEIVLRKIQFRKNIEYSYEIVLRK